MVSSIDQPFCCLIIYLMNQFFMLSVTPENSIYYHKNVYYSTTILRFSCEITKGVNVQMCENLKPRLKLQLFVIALGHHWMIHGGIHCTDITQILVISNRLRIHTRNTIVQNQVV